MSLITIDTAVLSSAHVIAYLDKCDRRCRDGFRTALEAMSIPLPEHANRKPTGPKPGKRIAAAFAADEAIHGDRTFTASGNRRIGNTVQPWQSSAPSSKPADPAPVSPSLFNDVFGR